MTEHLGELTAALAKAQSTFPVITRDKKVTVKLKTGGSYEFAYAPLDSILNAVRKPLAENGLVVIQTLDDGDLVTSLMHESGGAVSGRLALPASGDIQGLGSAITYLRRYAIQALLGIAAEEDDDGNRSIGNTTEEQGAETVRSGGETLELLGRIQKSGTLIPGAASGYKGEWRETPDGWAIGFKFKLSGEDRDIPQVLITGPIGSALHDDLGRRPADGRVTIKGHLYNVKPDGRKSYYRLVVGGYPEDFIETDDWRVPPSEQPAGVETPPAVAPGQEAAWDLTTEALS